MKLKGFANIFLKYKNYLMLSFIMFLTIMVVLSSTLERKYDLKLGEVSQYTIKAPRETQDKYSTEHRIKVAQDEVAAQFNHRKEVRYDVLEKLENLFKEFYELKDYQVIADSVFLDLNKNYGIELEINDYKAILSLDINDLNTYERFLSNVINKVYELKIEDGNVSDLENVKSFTREEINKTVEHEGFNEISVNIILPMIKPNFFYDHEKTEQKREEAAKNVSPVIVKKDQVIIEAGDIVNESHISILDSLGILKTSNINWGLNFAILALILLTFVIEYLYYRRYQKDCINNVNFLNVIMIIKFLVVILVRVIGEDYVYIVPFALGPLSITALINNNVSLMTNLMTLVLIGIITKFNIIVVFISLFNVILGTLFLKRLKNRIHFIKLSSWFGIINVIILTTITFIIGNVKSLMLLDIVFSFLGGILSAILVAGILPIFENLFNIVTSMKLLELINPEHPLLKKLVVEAPGTYNHSLMVANLAEAASDAIGANSLLTRVSAYYHDIGKTGKPYFFRENQVGSKNPHDRIDPLTSANIIFSHVKYGIQLAREYKLPKFVEHAIEGHHANTLAKYFYLTMKNNSKNPDEVNEKDFRYGGELPKTKEVTILMFADSVEAAVRSLSEPTQENIKKMIEDIVDDKIRDGQLKNSPISFKDIEIMKESFLKTLKGIYHERIEYPKEENKENNSGV